MRSIILCAFLTLFYLVANAQTPADTVFKSNGVIIVTSLQDVKVTAYQDAGTVSMNNVETLVTPSITKTILPTYIQQVRIYDGTDVLRKTFNYSNALTTQVKVDVSNLSTGTYFVETITNQKTIRKQKIVIAR